MTGSHYSVFKAIADPTRRHIIQRLVAAKQGLSINDLSSAYPSSRQAVSKHIKILNRAGLIEIRKYGRERYCYAEVKPLKEVYDWIIFYEQFWKQRLSALEAYLDEG